MRLFKVILILFGCFASLLHLSFIQQSDRLRDSSENIDSLRKLYSAHPRFWPAPTIDKGINWVELGAISKAPEIENLSQVKLGKVLFFDPRLSESNKLSCSSCHQPEKHWTDGLSVSIGHEKALNTRNSPSIQNVWFYKRLFWDGRARTLEEQAQFPLSSTVEMHQDLNTLAAKIKQIKGYHKLFKNAFGDEGVSNDRIFTSLAAFQKTVVSEKTAFDRFLEGEKSALSDKQLMGLHLFRTKARCMNCHYGPMFSDNEFHNLGLSNYGRKNQDLGLYLATKDPADVGKFKTPGLRNVSRTGPWFHDGSVSSLDSLMQLYNMGMPFPGFTLAQMDDPLLPKNDRLLRGIRLSKNEISAIISFLDAISTTPMKVKQVKLPK